MRNTMRKKEENNTLEYVLGPFQINLSMGCIEDLLSIPQSVRYRLGHAAISSCEIIASNSF